MLERLRMQEVSQIILSVPEGAVISGTNLTKNEPVMIINKPAMSNLSFLTKGQKAEDGRGFIGESGQTQYIDFTINDGSILYAVWSYLHGINTESGSVILKGTEWLNPEGAYLKLSTITEPISLILYKSLDGKLTKMEYNTDYTIFKNTKSGSEGYYIELVNPEKINYFTSYDYTISNVQYSNIKQIHNNIFCSLDVYFDAVDMDTDDKHTVCLHCDKVQVFSDLVIGINDSTKASFTPIKIKSIPQGNDINKDIATITVI